MTAARGELWENEFGSLPYSIDDRTSSIKDVLIYRKVELSVATNHDSPLGKKTIFAIRSPRLHVNMSNGAPRYHSEDGRLLLETRSDYINGVFLKPNMMWVLKCAKTMRVLMRSRRFAARRMEDDVCPHCLFLCPCGGHMDWKCDGDTVYSVFVNHVTRDGVALPIDAVVTDEHANMTIRVRAGLYDDVREIARSRCPDAKLLPFSTSSGKTCSDEVEGEVARYFRPPFTNSTGGPPPYSM